MLRFSIIILMLLTLTACSSEVDYRGVSQTTWNQLTTQQKQLIIDQSFNQQFNQPTQSGDQSS